jgi:hypothetical protein
MNAKQMIETLRNRVPTENMTADEFAEICRAMCFYVRGGNSIESSVDLAIDEVLTREREDELAAA